MSLLTRIETRKAITHRVEWTGYSNEPRQVRSTCRLLRSVRNSDLRESYDQPMN